MEGTTIEGRRFTGHKNIFSKRSCVNPEVKASDLPSPTYVVITDPTSGCDTNLTVLYCMYVDTVCVVDCGTLGCNAAVQFLLQS